MKNKILTLAGLVFVLIAIGVFLSATQKATAPHEEIPDISQVISDTVQGPKTANTDDTSTTSVQSFTASSDLPNPAQAKNINSFVAYFCNANIYPVHISQLDTETTEDGTQYENYFVWCEVPREIPIPTLYLIEKKDGDFWITWSKDLSYNNSALRSVGPPKLLDLNHDGVKEVYWSGSNWSMAFVSTAGFIYEPKIGREFSLFKTAESTYDQEGNVSRTQKPEEFSPKAGFDPAYVKPFRDYLEIAVESVP